MMKTFSASFEFELSHTQKKYMKNKMKKEKLVTNTYVYAPDVVYEGVNYSRALRRLIFAYEKKVGKSTRIKLARVKRELAGSILYKKLCNVPGAEIDIFQLRDEILRMIKVVSSDLPKARQLGLLD